MKKPPSLEEWVSAGMDLDHTALLDLVQQLEKSIDAYVNKPEVWVYVPKKERQHDA